jgi:hypothetical protein
MITLLYVYIYINKYTSPPVDCGTMSLQSIYIIYIYIYINIYIFKTLATAPAAEPRLASKFNVCVREKVGGTEREREILERDFKGP